jgi:hypothetical protein
VILARRVPGFERDPRRSSLRVTSSGWAELTVWPPERRAESRFSPHELASLLRLAVELGAAFDGASATTGDASVVDDAPARVLTFRFGDGERSLERFLR